MLTFEEMLVAFVIASVTGIGIGLSMGMWRKLDVALNPYVNALYVTPRIALIPLIIIWFGVGFSAIVFTVFLTAVFPILINTEAGVRNVSKSLLDVARVFNVQGIRRFRRVIFPATIPFTMAGLRLGVAEAFIGVIVAQMVLSLQGLGYQITTYGEFYDTPELIGTIIVLMIIGAGLTSLVQFIERKISYWKQTERAFE
jgi:ABC-type nitrate/sulfonate/bicarbonate transport system permease component